MLANGSKTLDKFDKPFNISNTNTDLSADYFDIARNMIYPFYETSFGDATVSVRFPSNEYHPSFGCTFEGQANFWSTFRCGRVCSSLFLFGSDIRFIRNSFKLSAIYP